MTLPCKKFRVVKPEIRVLGIDDGPFAPHKRGFAPIVGVVFRGGYWLDGIMFTKVTVDGLDATDKITSMIVNSPHYKQLRVIMLDGVTCAGFNVINIKDLNSATKLPIIAVTRDSPSFVDIGKALENLPDAKERWEAIKCSDRPYAIRTRSRESKVYVQPYGLCRDDAKRIVQLTSTRSDIPEPLRVAHLIASGIGAAETGQQS